MTIYSLDVLLFLFGINLIMNGSSLVGSAVKSACHEGDGRDADSIPELGRSPGKENGTTLQCSFLENSMDRGAWQATVHEVTIESDMT